MVGDVWVLCVGKGEIWGLKEIGRVIGIGVFVVIGTCGGVGGRARVAVDRCHVRGVVRGVSAHGVASVRRERGCA